MAVSNAVVHSVETLQSDYAQPVQVARVLFTIATTETYAQANNAILSGVPTLIANSRRNGGGTITMVGVAPGQYASKLATPEQYLGLKTVAISSSDVTFEVTDNSPTTEFADATAMAAQSRPFGILVSFIET
jgi:hypothetical protein